jgi:hypothetical protein
VSSQHFHLSITPDFIKATMTDLQTETFNELHLFIDESGNFDSMKKKEIKLIGGVLVFGEYNEIMEQRIKDSLITAVQSIQGKYPQGLHYFERKPKNNKLFSDTLMEQLDIFFKENNVQIYGVLIRHREDIFADASGILVECEFDNRYFLMLWSLIEYCVFVSDEINKRLTDDAVIHLHIARKSFNLHYDNEDYVNVVKSLGYNVHQDRNTKRYYVSTSVNEQTIRGMFSIALKNQWKTSKRTLKTIEMNPIVYNPYPGANDWKRREASSSALYLADILLGVERERLQYKPVQSLLPILESLEYGRKLEVIMRCKSCLADDNFDALIGIFADESIDPDDGRNQDIVNRLVQEFQQNRTPFYRLYEMSAEKVDNPVRRKHALQTIKLLDVVYQKTNQFDLFSELYSTLVSFSAANHSGDVRKAEANWNQYLELEKQVLLFGKKKGLEKARNIMLKFRSRRAVNLMDQFDFETAENIINEISQNEYRFCVNNSDDLQFVSTWRLGVCYSLMGQVGAFQKKYDIAINSFRYALNCFNEPDDIERIWVYCGHLACDFPETSTDLWNEAKEYLATVMKNHLPLEKPFVFAVLAKGILVFGDVMEKQEWLNKNNDILETSLSNILPMHPCGLILQTAAMLNADIWSETGDNIYAERADHFFGQAIRSLEAGENLLQFLSIACRLRYASFINEWKPTQENKQTCDSTLPIFVQKASEFGLTIPDTSPENALSGIRFNYW